MKTEKKDNYRSIGEVRFLEGNTARSSFLFSGPEPAAPAAAGTGSLEASEPAKEKETGKTGESEHIVSKRYRILSAGILWSWGIPIDFTGAGVLGRRK